MDYSNIKNKFQSRKFLRKELSYNDAMIEQLAEIIIPNTQVPKSNKMYYHIIEINLAKIEV